MSPVQTYKEEVRERFLDFWLRREEFGQPIGCIATSYTFDAAFFEEDCLGRFVGMDTQPDEDKRVYLVEREEKLSQVSCVVLVDVGHVPASRSLRWSLLPVTVPGGGIQHAKVSLLIWERHVRVLVGSANLTEYGYRRNFEHLGVLDFTEGGAAPLSLLTDVLRFLEGLALLSPQPGADAAEGPHAALRNLLTRVRRLTADWSPAPAGRGPSVAWLTTLPGEDPVFAQLQAEHWRGTGPDHAEVLSPFYDDGDRAKLQADGLIGLMGKRGELSITFRGPGRETPDGSTELGIPEALCKARQTRVEHHFEYVPELDEESQLRPLHAKSLWLQRDNRALFMIGSSNFTCAGYGTAAGPRNVEANLVYILPTVRDPFGRRCEACFPESRLAEDPVVFLQEIQEQTPDPQAFVPLPAGFGLALFVPGGETGSLRLYLGAELPASFRVAAEDGMEVLARVAAEVGEWPEPVKCSWHDKRPPSSLVVTWETAAGETVRSIWVVNVTNPAGLPPPEELRDLSLEELVEILSSARPLHEALSIVWRRLDGAKGLSTDLVFDPHKKVNTRNYLLRRVRRISGALEGLRQRLERPVYDLEALRWRLHGPIGPVALARRLADDEGEGAGFMIAEVAMTLQMTDWKRSEEFLGQATVRAEVAHTIDDLRALAEERQGPSNLADYVSKAFAGVRL